MKAVSLFLVLCVLNGRTQAADAPSRPNIVFILMDDLRWDDLSCTGHPFVKTPNIDRIAREGGLFRNAFATTPLCSPSRASFLTGLYSHTHGIVDNTERSVTSHRLITFPLLLHQAGYETAFIGKWHMGLDDQPRPGFDYWLSVRGQGAYVDPEVNENGKRQKLQGYVTDLFNDRAIAFLERPHNKPFLLYLSHKAVHPNLAQRADGSIADPNNAVFLPAERHKSMYADAPIPRRPNCRDDLAGKPALQRPIAGLPPLGPKTGTDDETVRNRLRMLMPAEEGVGRIVAALKKAGTLDDTVLIFTSDHGYFYGEHGLSVERRLAYEETIRIPLFVRYPKLIPAGSTYDAMVLSIDLMPTLLELGDAKSERTLHGRSLVPLLRGEARGWRKSLLVEHTSDHVFPRAEKLGYRCVRTERYKYIRYTDLAGMDELYDLAADPYEMENEIAIGDPRTQRRVEELQAELARLLEKSL